MIHYTCDRCEQEIPLVYPGISDAVVVYDVTMKGPSGSPIRRQFCTDCAAWFEVESSAMHRAQLSR